MWQAEIIDAKHQIKEHTRLLHELAFSIYLPLLMIVVNELTSMQHPVRVSWVDRLRFLITGGPDGSSYHFAFRLLWAASAATLFLSLRILARLSFMGVFLRTFAGVVAVAGFPLAAGYVSFRGYLHMLGSLPAALLYAYSPHRWLAIEVIASLVCVFVYVFLKWPAGAWWGLLLLSLHFAIWAGFMAYGRQERFLRYLLLGFLASLAWGLYVRQSTENPRPTKLMETKSGFAKYVRLAHELAFSVYFALLIICANAETARVPWVEKMQLLIAPGRTPHSYLDPALHLATALLWGLLAAINFVCLRMLARLSITSLICAPLGVSSPSLVFP